jgi:glutamyl-tRNA synthetase
MASGRFAPSPTGPLHVGHLRTALAAWAFARSVGSRFILRIEDLDRVASRAEHETAHRRDLAAIGIDWDGPVARQSERFDRYEAALASLEARALTYPCYCTRREIRDAVAAPHGPSAEGAYPGTCRQLTAIEQAERERDGRRPAWRLRAAGTIVTFTDRLRGAVDAVVDDFVLRRNDGAPAYNLAVVVDDADQGVEEVVRGDDLLFTTPRQIHLSHLLDLPVPSYAHVPLVMGPDGERLAKRHGAVTLGDLVDGGRTPADVRTMLAASLGIDSDGGPISMDVVARRFDPTRIPTDPWVFVPPLR